MESKIRKYLEELTEAENERCEALGYDFRHTYTVTETPKYFKIWQVLFNQQKSIFCFIDKETGDIYKPASTKAMAKGARGNIDGFKPLYSSQLYKRGIRG